MFSLLTFILWKEKERRKEGREGGEREGEKKEEDREGMKKKRKTIGMLDEFLSILGLLFIMQTE